MYILIKVEIYWSIISERKLLNNWYLIFIRFIYACHPPMTENHCNYNITYLLLMKRNQFEYRLDLNN